MLSISESEVAMGYEGYMAYDVSELINANPWKADSQLSKLPVYENPLTYDENFIASGVDVDKMRALLLEVAGRLGINTDDLTITDRLDPTELIIETKGIKIQVDQAMTATISFDSPISLPEKYNFTHHASYDEMLSIAEFLKTEYEDFIAMDDPQINIYGGDYDIYNQQMYTIEFFDGQGEETEQIINYNFNRAAFYCDDQRKLFMARIYEPDLSKKVGDYPIINLRQAKELLLNGNYLTTVPYEIAGEEYIQKGELLYRTGQQEEYYMPYYRFYVELPEAERENGMKTYGAYYVPAVESSYISNMPTWDGRFN
ncbi:MAG: hypothetical protein HFE73_03145 [Firmicutes bacterium]|nr:hypothetical protein [Bacillota bacterium]